MKKHNQKKTNNKIIVILLVAFVIISGGIVLFSRNNTTKNVEADKQKVKVEANEQCTKANCYTCSRSFSKDYYAITNVSATLSGTTVSVGGISSRARIKVVGSYSKNNSVESDYLYPDANGNVTYALPATNENVALDGATILIYPREQYKDDSTKTQCDPGDKLGQTEAIEIEGQVANPNYNSQICIDYRRDFSGNADMMSYLDTCFAPTIDPDAIVSDDDLAAYNNVARQLYAASSAFDNGQSELEPDAAGTLKVDDPTKKITLSCNAFATGEKYDNDGVLTEFDPSNVKTYSATKTVAERKYCTTECKETVTVSYQAPVATQAGLCFSYKVEIKSKVKCKAKKTNVRPTKKSLCRVVASCWGTYDAGHDQGGPSEDFDNCIQKCDGGKYSQACINSCYKETYPEEANGIKKTANTISYNDNVKVSKMANVSYAGVTCNSSFTGSKPTFSNYSAEQIYKFKQKYPGGSYVSTGNNTWKWVSGGDCPSDIGYYYFSTLALTRSSISGFRGKYQDPTGQGFKMQWWSGFHCDSTCYWRSSGCSSNSLTTQAAIDKDYQNQLAEQAADLEKCREAVDCNTTTTHYVITVDPQDTGSKNYHEYVVDQAPNHSPSGDGIMEDYSGNCYSKEDGWEYRNVLSFPESWLSVKSGKVLTKKPADAEHYQYLGHTFCTNLSSNPVNVDWYDWKVNKNMDPNIDQAKKDKINSERVDNINVRIGKNDQSHLWGLMGWNFDINCFYALIKDPDDCTEECCGSDCPGNTPDNPGDGGGGGGACNGEDCTIMPTYEFRTISLNNVFPNNRTPNFNWTSQARNTLNTDYPIVPDVLLADIQDKKDRVFTNDNEIDYEFELTADTLKAIKDYNNDDREGRKSGNYTDYAWGTLEPSEYVAGVTIYKSSFINTFLVSKGAVKKSGLIGCNNEYAGSCNKATSQSEGR